MIPRRYVLAMLGLSLGAIVMGGLFYPRLPERVPVHYNLAGEPDGYGSRWELSFLLPGINLALVGFFVLLPWIGPFRANFERFRVVYARICLTIIAGMAAIDLVMLMSAAGYPLDIGRSLSLVLGTIFVVTGNWLGKIKRNFYIGIRTPWTLANAEVWLRTHRVGAKLLVAVGLASVLCGLAAPGEVCFFVLVGGVIGIAVWSVVYSLVMYRRLGRADDMTA